MSEQEPKRLTTEEMDRLRTADVSPELLTIVRRDPETLGHERNSARAQVRSALRNRHPEAEGDDLRLNDRGGHYFGALRDGDIGGAFIRADIANTRLLLDTFDRDYLIESLIDGEGWSSERAARYVDERISEYGDGILL